MTQPSASTTQVRHPWRATARTTVAAIAGILPFVPAIVGEFGIGSVPWVAAGLAVIASATRVLAMPGVEVWMKTYVPWLAAAPAKPDTKPFGE